MLEAPKQNSEKLAMQSLFSPDNEQTKKLVQASGSERLEDFSILAGYFLNHEGFSSNHFDILSTLEQFKSEPEDILHQRLASPIFRGWLNQFGWVENWQPEDPLLKFLLSLLSNMRFKFCGRDNYEATFKVLNGCCMTYDPRVALRVATSEDVRVTKLENQITVTDSKTLEKQLQFVVLPNFSIETIYQKKGCAVLSCPTLPDTAIALRNDLPFLKLKLREAHVPGRYTGLEYGALDYRLESYPAFNPALFITAANFLKDAWLEEYTDFQQIIQVVIPRSAPKGWKMEGFTVESYQGACWIAAQTPLTVLEALVHEQSHVKLRYVEEAFPILATQQTEQLFKVGWRSDLRPIVGIYEGVYVHIHSLIALQKVINQKLVSWSESLEYKDRISELKTQVEEGYQILKNNAQFTELGSVFLDSVSEQLQQI